MELDEVTFQKMTMLWLTTMPGIRFGAAAWRVWVAAPDGAEGVGADQEEGQRVG